MDTVQSVGVQIGDHGGGKRGDGGDTLDHGRCSVTRQVKRPHFEIRGEVGDEGGEVITGAAEPVQQQQGLSVSGAVKSKNW